MLPYISTICKYTKIGNIFLFFFADPRLGLIYMVLCTLHLIFLPEPVYQGPDSILYFRDTTLELVGDIFVWLLLPGGATAGHQSQLAGGLLCPLEPCLCQLCPRLCPDLLQVCTLPYLL
ncbi:TMX2 [Cordylochernes scorpioides]|uniref:TMX2 n=1 Tax=Cordylochernes scorpioides TaxID=51811 RepID=A0ABY6LNC3_9ARAC|nr:TMX2 [Cordylochernes scorpioides]